MFWHRLLRNHVWKDVDEYRIQGETGEITVWDLIQKILYEDYEKDTK